MLIVPITNRINWKNPPVITLSLILINIVVFLVFQRNDNQNFFEAEQYYFKSGLAAIEAPYYAAYTSGSRDLSQPGEKKMKPEVLHQYHTQMETDAAFLEKLRNNEIIRRTDPVFNKWEPKRKRYEEIRSQSVSFRFGFKPAAFRPVTLLTCQFLHGSMGHLVGNMVFLWLVGCILEAGCGRLRYLFCYLIAGVVSGAFFGVIYLNNPMPLIGASGAIAGLMGMLAVLFGKKTIRVFYSLGFFFDYIKIRAGLLLVLWVGNELVQLFIGSVENIAYVAHIGGLLTGGLLAVVLLKIPGAVDETVFEDQSADPTGPMIEAALQKVKALDVKAGIHILNEALEKDPENSKILYHLFTLHRQTPDKPEFHDTAAKLITALANQRDTYVQASSVFDDYKSASKKIRLEPKLLLRLSFIWCELEEPEKAGSIISWLLKSKNQVQGMPAALLKLSQTFKKKGNIKNYNKCREYLCLKYPHSNEARLFEDMVLKN